MYYLYKTEPRKHQDEAFIFLYRLFNARTNYGALFMEQGTGKTKVAIDIACNLYAERRIDAVMLIAPNGVQDQWGDEQLPLHSALAYKTFTWDNNKSDKYRRELFAFIKSKPAATLKWFLMNVEAFSQKTNLMTFKEYVTMNRTLIIIDEATRIKSPDAERTINIIQGLSKLTTLGKRVTGVEPLSKFRLILTGTPVTTGPYNVWSMFEFLEHDYFKRDFMSFKGHYGIEIKSSVPGSRKTFYRKITSGEMKQIRQYYEKGKSFEDISRIMQISESSSRYIVDNPSITAPYKHLDELKQDIARVAFTVRKKDCLDLPDKIFEKRYVRLSAEQMRVYKELKTQMLSQYKDIELEVVNKLSLIGRLQQITGGFFPGKTDYEEDVLLPFDSNPKLNEMLEDIEGMEASSIIITARFTAELKAIYEAVKKRFPEKTAGLVYGGVSKDMRTVILTKFKACDLNILVANAKTIGVGQNLQNSHTMLMYSNGYSFEDREQLEDRIHRDGQSEAPVYIDYIVKGTVDEKVLEVLQEKRDLSDYMRDKNIGEFLG